MLFFMELFASFLLLMGAAFILVGALGMVKLPDFYTRLHAPTKATTLGIGCILLASMTLHALIDNELSIHEFVISLFLFITAPVSAYMVAKAALQRRTKFVEGTLNANMSETILERKAPE
ncbi:Na+/H+ antiporter subunit G [Neptunomonas concharum]|uniref:Na+/H+ antiporter subunit G n=1 Tax=Neptunomonas concharum TaxID=1031538 RepID=A0A5P1R9I7_9GAMM|nr:Na+/H+ antiporter subunit G [Neptunomonas concharum]QEQ95945.1 Na+/H+ antiporter subunit G [Neptunomonas concharum]